MNLSYFPDDVKLLDSSFINLFNNQSFVQFLHRNIAYLIILLTPDLSGRGIARDAETEIFLSEMTTPIVNVANLNSSSVDLYLFNDKVIINEI